MQDSGSDSSSSSYICPGNAMKEFKPPTNKCPEFFEDRDSSEACPQGYYPVQFTVQGKALKIAKNKTIDECADLCNEDPNCKGFQSTCHKTRMNGTPAPN